MAADEVLAFLKRVDDELTGHAEPGETLNLYLLGRAALILGYGLRLMTKDLDVVEEHDNRLLGVAERVFGKDAVKGRGHGFYLETVPSGLPPLPHGYQSRCVDVPGDWRVIRPKRPEAHDLVVTKLRRFHGGDRQDVQILCDTGEVDEEILRERFAIAHAFSDQDDPWVVRSGVNLEAVVGYLRGDRSAL
jgi:hypothetical protein